MTKSGNAELDPKKRAVLFQKADNVLASLVPMIPLYQRPAPVIHKADLLGVVNNPGLSGAYWNLEDWHWK